MVIPETRSRSRGRFMMLPYEAERKENVGESSVERGTGEAKRIQLNVSAETKMNVIAAMRTDKRSAVGSRSRAEWVGSLTKNLVIAQCVNVTKIGNICQIALIDRRIDADGPK